MSPVRLTADDPTTPGPPTTPKRKKIFTFTTPGNRSNPTTPNRLDTPNGEAYALSPVRPEVRKLLESPKRKARFVCRTPYRVLDAPELADDFYLNLVDWSSTNILGVGLSQAVYLWTAHTAKVEKLCDLQSEQDTISSISWVQKGSTLAIGTLHGRLHIYDANTLQLLRSYNHAHQQRIGALAWNAHVLSSGSRDRFVHHRDVREPTVKPFRKAAGHRQEVCGLKWSQGSGPESSWLASGGNDNKVCIWDLRGSRRQASLSSLRSDGGGSGSVSASSSVNSSTFEVSTGPFTDVDAPSAADDDVGDQPLYKFHEHTAAVKALAWDPHLNGTLATGGGTQDKKIRFWNVQNGTKSFEMDTGSQVCSSALFASYRTHTFSFLQVCNLTWSLNSHELVSTHGFSSTTAQNQICIWKYPTLDQVASLVGHTHRVLYLATSPDGETIVTGAGDETLRFWDAFPKKGSDKLKRESKLDFGRQIR